MVLAVVLVGVAVRAEWFLEVLRIEVNITRFSS